MRVTLLWHTKNSTVILYFIKYKILKLINVHRGPCSRRFDVLLLNVNLMRNRKKLRNIRTLRVLWLPTIYNIASQAYTAFWKSYVIVKYLRPTNYTMHNTLIVYTCNMYNTQSADKTILGHPVVTLQGTIFRENTASTKKKKIQTIMYDDNSTCTCCRLTNSLEEPHTHTWCPRLIFLHRPAGPLAV